MTRRLGHPASTQYTYPALCTRCGTADASVSGQIIKSSNNRFFRFFWEKVERVTLTVPVCSSCKALLDKHTLRAGLCATAGYLLGAGAVIGFGYGWVDWVILLLAAPWGAALVSRLLAGLYRRLFHQPPGITWPELCTYEDEILAFWQPEFQRQFIRLNAG
jgi:hypothetical protein